MENSWISLVLNLDGDKTRIAEQWNPLWWFQSEINKEFRNTILKKGEVQMEYNGFKKIPASSR